MGELVAADGKPVSIATSWHGSEDAAAPVRTRACGRVFGIPSPNSEIRVILRAWDDDPALPYRE